MELKDAIKKFVADKWDDKCAYTTTYFEQTYHFSRDATRFHLNGLVAAGKLIALKIEQRVYYMKPENYDRFEPYTKIKGVRFVQNNQKKQKW
jgi:hypothetical protein